VYLRVARLQERNGDARIDWSVFQGSFDPGAPRSWLLRRLRRSVFRHHPTKAGFGPITQQSSTVVAHHERESWMARRKLTVDRHEEIKRRLADGRSLREIATALGCSRRLVRQIRDGDRLTHETAASPDPLWMAQLEWPVIIHELGLGHPIKFISEERAKALNSAPLEKGRVELSNRGSAGNPCKVGPFTRNRAGPLREIVHIRLKR
jgi:Homeodomain-like domain